MTTAAGERPNDDIIEVRAAAAERLTFFVDAVIAIALTLLALDLPVPSGNTNREVLRSALDHRDDYLAFAISFVVIAAYWNGHHRIFKYVRALGGRLMSLTLAWLFLQVIMPFATRVITGDGAFQARFGFYAVVQIATSLIFALMVRVIKKEHLYTDAAPPGIFVESHMRTIGLVAGFGISIPISFFTGYAYACWFAAPVLVGVVHRVQGRRAAVTRA